MHNEIDYQIQLKKFIESNMLIMQILHQLYTVEPSAYIAAGIIRNTIWSHLHHFEYALDGTEVDVIFHNLSEDPQPSKKMTACMSKVFPNMQWDVTNQATVHHWYRLENGEAIAPLASIEHALSMWPETATAVAIRLNAHDQLEIVAPFGLADLFELKLRWNSTLVSYEGFMKRIKQKKMMSRWPKLELIDSHIENKSDRDERYLAQNIKKPIRR